jgi:hypothetical protein
VRRKHPLRYGFERRVELYAGWDRQLREKTRFFAAASLTNRVLAAMARMTFPTSLSPGACGILDSLGAALELSNRSLVSRLLEEQCCGTVLDRRLVEFEQSLVERFLSQTAIAAPGNLRVVTGEIDGLLNRQAPWSICDKLFPTVCGYLAVLKHVRGEVKPPIQFAQQDHRVRIGQELIACIRGGTISVPYVKGC